MSAATTLALICRHNLQDDHRPGICEAGLKSAIDPAMLLQVVSTVDPFGYYAEGVQQGLDDAFRPRLQTDDMPSPRPSTAPRAAAARPLDGPSAAARPASATPAEQSPPKAAAGEQLMSALPMPFTVWLQEVLSETLQAS